MQPFEKMNFCYSWRPYQERVLMAIKAHLDDKRLHVVAAPGAGKTTLGLEVFRLLQKPTLVLSPTRIIRDQWIERLKDFVDEENVTELDWVSNSIQEPKVLTSITYQALHAKFAEELNEVEEEISLEQDEGLEKDEVNGFIKTIEQHDIQVLILDEAHHLRAEWWRALERVCAHFPNIILVSLTATPPYDSQGHEWSRYEQLCGPIDEEISVPELVKAGTLCAHQDFIWACNATANEKKQVQDYDDRVSTVCNTLYNSGEFQDIVLAHPWLHSCKIESDIIKEPHIAIALLSYIKAKSLPSNEELMVLLDLSEQDIPELGRHWWQVLVETILFSKTTQLDGNSQEFIAQLKKQLKSSDLLYKRELSLERSRRMERSLALSTSKASACATIHQLEYKHRGEELRQVILADYIRDEALSSGLDTGEINLGAWPIFHSLISSSPVPNDVALLTGRISIIPSSKLELLLNNIESNKVKVESIAGTQHYKKVSAPLNQLTSAFTALLMKGDIKALVGTRSLLGEGWDAPSINSLILASSVGSFMLTNQMRGRAIRIDKNNESKVSSIWHLVAINADSYAGWSDFGNLTKRFETFVGLSEKDRSIESGFERMDATSLQAINTRIKTTPITGNNRQMLRRYRNLHRVSERWQNALTVDETARIVPSVKTNNALGMRGLLLKQSFSYLVTQIVTAIVGLLASMWYVQPRSGSTLVLFLILACVGGLIYKLPKTISTIKVVLLYLPIDGALTQIGKALAEALCRVGFVETSIRNMKVNVIKSSDGTYYLSLLGATFYESALFSDCLAEILAPIDNPRYLIVREGKFLGSTRIDYHAVPMKFAVKKEYAQVFYKSWQKNVSLSELIYTRTEVGRKRLLKAKMKSFSSMFRDEVRRQDRWQ